MKENNHILLNLSVYFLVFIVFQIHFPAGAQSYAPQQIELAEQLHSFSKNAPRELVYVQTSKDIYETGEDLWFKVYLLDAQYLIPSDLSRTLYLQLLNEASKKTVWQEKYEIQNGFANGRVYINSNLSEGDYLLEVFTANSFFSDTTEFKTLKRIKIVKEVTSKPLEKPTSKNPSLIAPERERKNSIQFSTFPEGGDLVSGLKIKLAFKAVNINGEPVDIRGTLFENNSPVVEFKSVHAGMGCFVFTPVIDKRYFIRLTEPAIDSTFPLPEIHPSGMTLQLVGKNNESLSFKVTQSSGINPGDIYLRVQCRGIVYGIAKGNLERELLMKVPLSDLPQGIMEVALFNSDLMPVAERLVYVNQEQKLNITTKFSKDIYPTRGKVVMKIMVKDENGEPVVANLGVSVFDKIYQNTRDSSNILSHIYLSSQLKGRIYNPSFYFNSDSKERDEALDLLMLTQGWRKYLWNEMNLTRYKEEQPQVIFDGIQGNVYYPDRKNKVPREQTFVMAFSPNKDSTKFVIPVDSAGEFTVFPKQLKEWENDYVYLKPFCSYDAQKPLKRYDPLAPVEYSLLIESPDAYETINNLIKIKEVSYPVPGVINETGDQSDLYSVESGVVRIKEVTIKGQKSNIIRGKYMGTLDSLAGLKADDDYVCRYGILNCPRHDRNEMGSSKPIQGLEYGVLIDYNTPGERMRRVVYWRPVYKEDELLKMNNLTRVKAYYGKREFYQPDYDKETDFASIPDFRNTLLWTPSVITDENGEATLSFYCSDINTDFVSRIEGVGGEGLLGAGYFKLTVRKMKFIP
jgi:hypothetical protein